MTDTIFRTPDAAPLHEPLVGTYALSSIGQRLRALGTARTVAGQGNRAVVRRGA